ncbi:MAG TPA: MerR family transcriptional regulator [Acidimicrobiia bacterium]
MSTRDPVHLSIGEVLAELRDEFPDVTISKIRFLESQGLVDPERTPSGYRKFYDHDLARLRWILHQQRAHFLPLKVIKERLDQLPPGDEALLDPEPANASLASRPVSTEPAPEPVRVPAADVPPAAREREPARSRPPTFAPNLPLDDDTGDSPLRSANAPDDIGSYSRAQLAKAAGIDEAQVGELEGFGLITPAREAHGDARFDDDALEVATLASGFFRRGIEARHLRMYRTFAEREAVLFGQVLMPFVRQRNPEARSRLQDELIDLALLGRRLRTALLREAVRETLAE